MLSNNQPEIKKMGRILLLMAILIHAGIGIYLDVAQIDWGKG